MRAIAPIVQQMSQRINDTWDILWDNLWIRAGRRQAPPPRFDAARIAASQETAMPAVQVDYRDRISVVTWLIVFGLGISLLFTMPGVFRFQFMALGSPVAIEVTDSVIASLFLAALAAAGTQSVVSVHPALLGKSGRVRRRSWVFSALPMALTIITSYLLPLAPGRFLQVLMLLITGALVALALFCLYNTAASGQTGFRRSRFILNALSYGSALLLFLFVYQTRTRSLLSATVISVTATLLAVEILRNTTDRIDLGFAYGAIVGLVLGQVTWALNYWPIPALTGGLMLLLAFYLLVGVAQQGLQKHISHRILIEFAIVTVVALLLIALIGPGFG